MIRSGKYGELITLNDYEWMVVTAAQMGGLQVADPTPVAPNPGMSLEQIKNALLFRVGDKDGSVEYGVSDRF